MPIWILAAGGASAQAPATVVRDPGFRHFLPHFEEGTSRFINGDPTVWKQNASRSGDTTIMGGWAAYERGWTDVAARYDWAAARFRDSGAKVTVEYLSSGVSGDLAYTVAIERCEIRLTGQDKPTVMPLRVTNIFRKEDGEWKLLHHHADPIVAKTAPPAVLQK